MAHALRAACLVRGRQELVIPTVLGGADVVLAAETGSGKTLAYIAPIASALLTTLAAAPPPGAAAARAGGDSANSSSSSSSRQPAPRWMALVLCPNTALCQQVVRLASSLPRPGGGALLRACHINSRSPPPFEAPDVVVATPGALVTLFNDRGVSYGAAWTAEGVASRTAVLVVDEADLLLQGGYEKDVIRLLDVSALALRACVCVCVCVGATAGAVRVR
jgi:superfamily II DNA/RNA helicase